MTLSSRLCHHDSVIKALSSWHRGSCCPSGSPMPSPPSSLALGRRPVHRRPLTTERILNRAAHHPGRSRGCGGVNFLCVVFVSKRSRRALAPITQKQRQSSAAGGALLKSSWLSSTVMTLHVTPTT